MSSGAGTVECRDKALTFSLLAEMRDFLIATVITQKRAIETVVAQFF